MQIDVVEMTKRCYEASKSKGFWDAERNVGEAFTLILSELFEAFEAHRKNKFASLKGFEYCLENPFPFGGGKDKIEDFKIAFTAKIKDTVEDEFADTIIRIFDFCGGFNINPIIFNNLGYLDRHFELCKNFGEKTLRLMFISSTAYYTETASEAIKIVYQHILYWCKELNIDIEKHIELKLQYNGTRGYKHDKQY